MEDWQRVVARWRALSPEEKHRRRWASIPRLVASSFAFEGEPIDLAALEAEHARQAMPPVTPSQSAKGASTSREIDQGAEGCAKAGAPDCGTNPNLRRLQGEKDRDGKPAADGQQPSRDRH